MTPSNTLRGLDRPSGSRARPERRTEALVAAYIHELSPRHHAERESRRPWGGAGYSDGRIVR